MNQNGYRSLKLNLSGISFWITLLVIFWVLGAVGLGWLVKSFLVLVGLVLVAPLIGFMALQWWLKRNLIEAQCPVCRYQFTSINGMQSRCPNCSEPLKIENGSLVRLTPPGTVDVEAIEVSTQQIEDKDFPNHL